MPLVADLLRPDSPIEAGELVPTLLSEPEASLRTTLEIFDRPQLQNVVADARMLLECLEQQNFPIEEAQARLALLETALHRT